MEKSRAVIGTIPSLDWDGRKAANAIKGKTFYSGYWISTKQGCFQYPEQTTLNSTVEY